ncbi:hypothetical protein O3P69_012466 [Scylla paramamosain]|uniref:Uncharacterized protein n=1 Tax=Scylla paramamosain TaxID=85552 RepID=A0AAW0SDC5_SCYPA
MMKHNKVGVASGSGICRLVRPCQSAGQCVSSHRRERKYAALPRLASPRLAAVGGVAPASPPTRTIANSDHHQLGPGLY